VGDQLRQEPQCLDFELVCVSLSRSDPEKEFERAKMSAMGSLGLKMHTRQQLRDKLLSKEYAEDVTERALDRMEELVSAWFWFSEPN